MITDNSVTYKPLIKAGIVLGVGLGGLFDGIVFHQLLQLHNMLSATHPKTTITNIEVNMFWDGLFHAFTWMMTLVGVALLWKAGKRTDVPWSGRTLTGSMLMGWGIFNLVEGIVDHHILHLHHVVEAMGQSVYDFLFLLSGLAMMLAGWMLIRSERQSELIIHPSPAKA